MRYDDLFVMMRLIFETLQMRSMSSRFHSETFTLVVYAQAQRKGRESRRST
jgi:hypothetical protein